MHEDFQCLSLPITFQVNIVINKKIVIATSNCSPIANHIIDEYKRCRSKMRREKQKKLRELDILYSAYNM